MCSGAQAELIDSVKLANQAYLVSESHLYRYDGATGAVLSTIALEQEPVALAASDSALFIAYPSKVEKRDLTGALVADPSGGAVSRSLPNIKDIAVIGDNVYVVFFGGYYLHELKGQDLSTEAGADANYYTLTDRMDQLVAYSGGSNAFYSVGAGGLNKLNWPPVINGVGEAVVEEYSPQLEPWGLRSSAENLFIMDGVGEPQILMDNGLGWELDGTQVAGWVDGPSFLFADHADDGKWTVVRNGIRACESDDALNWATDLVNYDPNGEFVSRTKAGAEGENFNMVYLWGSADPDAHLFREAAPGTLDVEIHSRSEGVPFDDGKSEFSVAPDEQMSAFQKSAIGVNNQHISLEQHITFNDDNTKAYVLHQGDEECQSAVRVYDLENSVWIDAFPLRWRADAIAMVGGASPDSSDDQLAVVYKSGFDSYGYSHMVVSYVDINAAEPAEDPAKDFLEYKPSQSFHPGSGATGVRVTRNAVLFKTSSDTAGEDITAWTPLGVKDTYDASDTALLSWSTLALHGEQARLVVQRVDGNDKIVELLNISDTAGSFAFDVPFETHVLHDSVELGATRMTISPNMEWFTLEDFDFTSLFRRGSQAITEGMASDFMPVSSHASTWSRTVQGDAGQPAFYTVSGGDNFGVTAAEVERWVMSIGSDDHFAADAMDSVRLPGRPLLLKVVDASTDDLLLVTLYQDQVLFTPLNKTLSNVPDFEPSGGGDNTGGDTGGDTSGSGGNNSGGSASGSGFSSGGGGGGGSVAWLFPLVLLVAGRLRQLNAK